LVAYFEIKNHIRIFFDGINTDASLDNGTEYIPDFAPLLVAITIFTWFFFQGNEKKKGERI
jgi:hypothetical protein